MLSIRLHFGSVRIVQVLWCRGLSHYFGCTHPKSKCRDQVPSVLPIQHLGNASGRQKMTTEGAGCPPLIWKSDRIPGSWL